MKEKKKIKHNSFVGSVLNGLADLNVTCRPMFGCFGLYHDGVFFAIICQDELFFRTDEITQKKYIDMKMEPLIFRDNQKSNSYFCVPAQILRSSSKLCLWAREAVEVQRRREVVKKTKRG